ncbi:MAG TPA: glycoside hydrolase family 3 N-terminal domain-containing protein [Candidatus Babeliales bacterium]|nr:glycoside hydrolase family 3 N-terminal domain-containing protein [Candidatus Babeliales bacterium]
MYQLNAQIITFLTIALSLANNPSISHAKPKISTIKTPIVADLTLAEKVGQLMLVSFRGEIANLDAHQLIQELYIGGIIYYNWANNLTNLEQIRKLGADLQQLAGQTRLKIPLLIAVDQEGGKVARCPLTKSPGNQALGLTNNPELAKNSAHITGRELKALNINTNLAPVVDINSNPQNPVIGSRSFGDTPEIVTTFGAQALAGYHTAGVITTLKHFPGHGDTSADSHLDLPVVHKALAELQTTELYPFAQLTNQTDMIMTAHILVPALDPDYCATLSRKTLNYLRAKIGFNGVIITDSLVMAGVLKQVDQSVAEAAIQALRAGHDIILLGGAQLHGCNIIKELTVTDILAVQQAIIQAVKTNRISEAQIDLSVQRVLNLKQKYLSLF